MDFDLETIAKLGPILAIPGAIAGSYIGSLIQGAKLGVVIKGILVRLDKQDKDLEKIEEKTEANSIAVARIGGRLNGGTA